MSEIKPRPILSAPIVPRPIKGQPTPEVAPEPRAIAPRGIVEREEIMLQAIAKVAQRPLNYETRCILRGLILKFRSDFTLDF